MLNKLVLFVVLVAIFQHENRLLAQQYQENNLGINIGIVAALGNKFDRLGVTINTFYTKDFFQINSELKCYFNFKSLGPNQQYIEAVGSLGVIFGYGSTSNENNRFYTSVSNQTGRRNSFGYSFNYYFNNIKTKQQTGTISIKIDHVSIISENDLFAKPKLDRFRTGAFLIQYQNGDYSFGANTTLFTGLMGHKVKDNNYPAQQYKCDIGGLYCGYSHGLLSAQFKYVDQYYQKYQANLGVDSERIRNVIQNRFIHDMVFLPKAWRKSSSAHIPMLDKNNKQYLFKKDQKIKPASIYWNGFLNPGIFY